METKWLRETHCPRQATCCRDEVDSIPGPYQCGGHLIGAAPEILFSSIEKSIHRTSRATLARL